MIRPIPLFLCWLAVLALSGSAFARSVNVPLADGFDCPVGKPDGKGYYVFRGFAPNGHLGEDWNGNGGGDTDLGDPVYATADGVVVFSADVRVGWGNCVIVRHVYRDTDGTVRMVDSLYGHLDKRLVRVDQIVRRGQPVGTIGTAHGIYAAHLHFEMRKNLNVGMNRSKFPRDFSVYYSPRQFVASHRQIAGGRSFPVPVDTFGEYRPESGPTPPRQLPTRDAVTKDDAQKRREALDKLIQQNKKNAQALTDQEENSFWERLKQKLKNGRPAGSSERP